MPSYTSYALRSIGIYYTEFESPAQTRSCCSHLSDYQWIHIVVLSLLLITPSNTLLLLLWTIISFKFFQSKDMNNCTIYSIVKQRTFTRTTTIYIYKKRRNSDLKQKLDIKLYCKFYKVEETMPAIGICTTIGESSKSSITYYSTSSSVIPNPDCAAVAINLCNLRNKCYFAMQNYTFFG